MRKKRNHKSLKTHHKNEEITTKLKTGQSDESWRKLNSMRIKQIKSLNSITHTGPSVITGFGNVQTAVFWQIFAANWQSSSFICENLLSRLNLRIFDFPNVSRKYTAEYSKWYFVSRGWHKLFPFFFTSIPNQFSYIWRKKNRSDKTTKRKSLLFGFFRDTKKKQK